MAKALRTAGMIVTAVALVATGVGAIAMAGYAGTVTVAGVAASTLAQIGVGLSMAGSLAEGKPKVGGSAGTPTDFKADPSAGIPVVIGRAGSGGNIVLTATTGQKGKYLNFVTVHSLGPIQGYEGFTANGEAVSFTTPGRNGEEAAGRYLNRMWRVTRLGTDTQTSLAYTATGSKDTPADHGGNVTSFWTSAHRLRSLACTLWGLEYDTKIFAAGVPKPQEVVLGPAVYDPREDDTYPGGSGPQRIDNEATWSFAGNDNPFLQALTFAVGRRRNGILVTGLGFPASGIDIAAHVEGANVCDANAWKIGGVYYTTDPKYDVYRAMLMAGGGVPVPMGDRLGCMVNTPRVSLDTLTGADLRGAWSVQAASSRRGRPNQIIPSYLSEAHSWEVVPAGPVKIDDYVEIDGRLRSAEVEYRLCPQAAQAAQLAAYEAVNAREFGPITLPCGPRWDGYKPGDCITIEENELGLASQKVLIFRRNVDQQSGVVTLTLRSETDAKHDFCLGRTASPPPVPGLSHVDPSVVEAPTTGSWVAIGGFLQGPDGGKLPAIIITGEVDDPSATHLIAEYREVPIDAEPGPWVGNEYPASSTRIEITGLKSGATYQVRVRYRTVRGADDVEVYADLGLVTVGSVTAVEALTSFAVTEIGGLTPAQLVDELQANSAQGAALTQSTLELSLRAIEERGQLITETFRDGVRVRRILIDDDEVFDDGDKSLWSRTKLMAILADDGNSMIMQHDTLMWSPGESFADHVEAIRTQIGTDIASATTSIHTWVNSSSAGATWINALEASYGGNFRGSITNTSSVVSGMGATSTLTLNVNGHISGTRQVNNGTTSSFIVLADQIGFSNSGGSTLYPLAIVGGIVRATNLEVDRVKAHSIVADWILGGEITDAVKSSSGATVSLSVGSWATLRSVNYVSRGGRLEIGSLSTIQSVSTDSYVTFQILVDGSQLDSWPNYVFGGAYDRSYSEADWTPSAGFHTITFQAMLEPGSGTTNAVVNSLKITEHKTET